MLFSALKLKWGRLFARFSSSNIERSAAHLSPLAAYMQLVTEKKIKRDERQLHVVHLLDTLSNQMRSYNADADKKTSSPCMFVLLCASIAFC